jgi:6-phosphogluconate dehydrogenase
MARHFPTTSDRWALPAVPVPASCLASSAGVVGLWEGAAASACQLSACQVGISQLHALHVVLLIHKGLAIADLQLVAGASLIDQGGNMSNEIWIHRIVLDARAGY